MESWSELIFSLGNTSAYSISHVHFSEVIFAVMYSRGEGMQKVNGVLVQVICTLACYIMHSNGTHVLAHVILNLYDYLRRSVHVVILLLQYVCNVQCMEVVVCGGS